MNRNSLVYQLNVLLENTSIDRELGELQRVAQDLKRNEGIEISVDSLKKLFYDADEVTLDKKVWEKLENTESNDIDRGDMEAAYKVAKTYKKTSPDKLKRKFEDDTYERPLILKFGDRYHLVAGNTRLSTAAAMGFTPKVIIAELPTELVEENVSANVAGYQSPNIFMSKPARKSDKKKQDDIIYQLPFKKAKKSYKNTIKAYSSKKNK